MPFKDKTHFNQYVHGTHGGDFEAAYEQFATSDLAPRCCADDFQPLLFYEDGEAIPDDSRAKPHPDLDFMQSNPIFQALHEEIRESVGDNAAYWAARSRERFPQATVRNSETWLEHQQADSADRCPPAQEPIELSTLNVYQKFAYDVILEHDTRWRTDPLNTAPLSALIHGTAGSGKTYLIRALEDEFDERCLIMAPTGVAADNIGGRTYHSIFPLPRKPKEGGDIKPGPQRMKSFRERLQCVTHLIFDEMSMIGRCSLGVIDELLRQANRKQYDVPFGGVNIILVGDHGQLAPVKDCRSYDISGLRLAGTKDKVGEWLASAPTWDRRGVEAYERLYKHNFVFFLDRIERARSASANAEEQARLEHFRSMQLRARDGELTQEDVAYIEQEMALTPERRAEFLDPTVYQLVTTRAMRDEKNAATLQRMIAEGKPGIIIKAVNTSTEVATASEDEMKLLNELCLCIGARVMINTNLCVALGLVNGLVGAVEDIICDDNGRPVSVLLRVPRKVGDASSGFSGDSFLAEHEAPSRFDPELEALIAIPRIKLELHNQSEHARIQFPLMLAWAVTIHKAQGLTLKRVTVDIGEDETHCGSTFTALTRVRDPKHLVFYPTPSAVRLTEKIATKPMLYSRRVHERQLRLNARRTARLFSGHASIMPPADILCYEAGAQLKRPRKMPSSGRDKKQKKTATMLNFGTANCGKSSSSAAGTSGMGANSGNRTEFQRNRDELAELGLSTQLRRAKRGDNLPQWVNDAFGSTGLLEATIVDFLQPPNGSVAAQQMQRYLQYIGFDVNYVAGPAAQTGASCGIVAAHVVCRWLRELREGRDPMALSATSLQTCVAEELIVDANRELGLFPERPDQRPCARCLDTDHAALHCTKQRALASATSTCFLGVPHVARLLHHGGCRLDETHLYQITSYDTTIATLGRELHALATRAEGMTGPAFQEGHGFFIANSEYSASRGYHWFAVFWKARAEPHARGFTSPGAAENRPGPTDSDDDEVLAFLDQIEAEHAEDVGRGDEPYPDDELGDEFAYELDDDAQCDLLDEEMSLAFPDD